MPYQFCREMTDFCAEIPDARPTSFAVFPDCGGSAAGAFLNWIESMESAMRHCSVPTDLQTLAMAEPGQALEIRHILHGAEVSCNRLQRGDVMLCRDVTSRAILLDRPNGTGVRIPLDCARYVQVEVVVAALPANRRESIGGAI